MVRLSRSLFVLFVVFFAPLALAQGVDPALYSSLKWRLVGPFRGGRSIAVAGSQSRPQEYYFGATGGGVWKTVNGGVDWACVSDGYFKTSSVGALAVAPSNPDIVFAGMGERDIRGNISEGDGVYRSLDGGKTWRNVGLAECRTIARIVVHPTNPDIVYVAALGHLYGPNRERGVFKSTDGGATWQKVLYESDKAGAVHIVMDPGDPETLYAATWECFRTPYSMSSGGPGSKLWKTTDGGRNWVDLSRNPGLPIGLLGKIGITVSPANPKRVWAIVEATDGGIFRSDDAGATWQLTNGDRNWRQRAFYYTHVVADPKDPEAVYVMNVGMGRSTDGGKTFRGMGTPHSDNHDLWIAPDDPNRMIQANDGGANVSTDGGRTWTEQDVPTSQFYHVSTDNFFPYRIYGAQQDNSAIRIASRSSSSQGIGRADWIGTAGGESGYVVPDPSDPEIVYGGNYGGLLERQNHRAGTSRDVNPWPDNPIGHGAIDMVHRMQWTFPIVFSPHDPDVLYTCSQYVMRSTNEGQTWKRISPDLTRNDPATLQPSGGPITKDNTGVEVYATVFTLAESPRRRGVLWAGSDDGLIHVSQNSGGRWTNVTPEGMPKWGLVSIIEASPHDPATAFAAVDNHENDDYAPYLYRTTDYGKTWTKIVGGIPGDTFMRVIREDPVRRGLLYAGSESGIYVSFDNGDHWQSLQLNLPVAPVHDLTLKDNDLVVATHGRAFWVLDDVTPLHALAGMDATKAAFFAPRPTSKATFGGGGFGGGRGGRRGPAAEPAENFGENPPSGPTLNYWLPSDAKEVSVEVLDKEGVVVSSRSGLPRTKGLNRATFPAMRYPSYRAVPGMVFWAAGPRPIPAAPGEYTVRLKVDGQDLSQPFRLLRDPRSEATEANLIAQTEFAKKISARVDAANGAVLQVRDVRAKIEKAASEEPSIGDDGKAIVAKLTEVEEAIYQTKLRSGQDPLNYPIRLNNKIAALLGVVLTGDWRPTDQSVEVFNRLSGELQIELDKLQKVLSTDLKALNDKLQRAGKPTISVEKTS
jgi:photosystem II stability/assembly factor-like uncharacterized protein